MATLYRWIAYDKHGRKFRGIVSGESTKEVHSGLKKLDLDPQADGIVELTPEQMKNLSAYSEIDEKLYGRCTNCEKKFGADPAMDSVTCAECGVRNPIPQTVRDAKLAELREKEEFFDALYSTE